MYMNLSLYIFHCISKGWFEGENCKYLSTSFENIKISLLNRVVTKETFPL